MAGRKRPSARARAVPLIVAGLLTDAQIAKEVGCAETSVRDWRQQEMGAAATKALPPASVEAIAQKVAEVLEPDGASPHEELPELVVPADLGPSVQRLLYRGMLAQERILETVTRPEYVLTQPAGEMADLLRTLGTTTARFFEAGERVLVAQLELARAKADAEKSKIAGAAR